MITKIDMMTAPLFTRALFVYCCRSPCSTACGISGRQYKPQSHAGCCAWLGWWASCWHHVYCLSAASSRYVTRPAVLHHVYCIVFSASCVLPIKSLKPMCHEPFCATSCVLHLVYCTLCTAQCVLLFTVLLQTVWLTCCAVPCRAVLCAG
jgi:hypothetical protein